MTAPIRLTVYGTAQPQGNKTGFASKNGKVVMVEGRRGPARDNFKDWRSAVATAARQWQEDQGARGTVLLDESVSVELTFWLPRPKSAPKWKVWASGRPDIDKLARAVLDAITGTLLANDSRVVRLVCEKPYTLDAPRADIVVIPLGEVERAGLAPALVRAAVAAS